MVNTMFGTHQVMTYDEHSICFHGDKIKFFLLCFEVLKPKQTKCALQKNEPPSYDIQAFINSLS